MNDPPVHPVTGEPLTPEELIADSDKLDAILASGDFAGLVSQVAGQRALQRRSDRNTKILAVVAVIAIGTSAFSTYWAFRVDHNTRELNRTKEALQVFCRTTNAFNAEAHTKFIVQFAGAADPAKLSEFADVAWPQRDCESLVDVP